MKAATYFLPYTLSKFAFQSTPPVKAATVAVAPFVGFSFISIHAAREGGDTKEARKNNMLAISIHAAREGGDAAIDTP